MNDAPTDDEILIAAQEIRAKDPEISLTDAMIRAEKKLTKDNPITVFKLELHLKPRVAKFYRDEFAGHPELSVEERMALWITGLLNEQRGRSLQRARENNSNATVPETTGNKALAMSRSKFLEQTG